MPDSPIVALVTCNPLPEPDPDEQPLLDACRNAGIAAELAAWDDSGVDWGRYACAVLRSAWNYHERERAFREWVASTAKATKLWNPPGLVLRTIDKRYLGAFEQAGIPIVPTRILSAGSHLADVISETGWDEFVVKPTVSAASYGTERFLARDLPEAARFSTSLQRERDVMVQEYMPSTENGGEVNIAFIDGELSHAVVKHPRFADGVESISDAIELNDAQIAAARRVIRMVTEPWLYARVDLMRSGAGEWLLSELEVIEPSLFFVQYPAALDPFVGAIAREAGA